MVRVPGQETGPIGKMLDTAIDALMVPMVEDVAQAEKLVQAVKFPPLGKRSYGARRTIDLFGRTYAHDGKPQPLLVCQIENEQGLKNVDAIATVEGVDALFFGADDMAVGQGLPMDKPRPDGYFDEALAKVAQAAKANGKIAGGVFADAQGMTQAIEMGYTLNVATAEVGLLANGSKDVAGKMRQCPGTVQKKNNGNGMEQGIY